MSARAILKGKPGKKVFVCSECRNVFLNYGEYIGDLIEGDGYFTCPKCGVEFDE